MKKTDIKKWGKCIQSLSLSAEKIIAKQIKGCTHTVDGKKIEVGLEVFSIGHPVSSWIITDFTEEIVFRKKTVTLLSEGITMHAHTTSLFVSHKEALKASIKDINYTKKQIMADMEESLLRLDSKKRLKQYKLLLKSGVS